MKSIEQLQKRLEEVREEFEEAQQDLEVADDPIYARYNLEYVEGQKVMLEWILRD